MKKLLTAIVAASFLTLGAGDYADKKDTKEYQDCVKKYENLVPGWDYFEGKVFMGFDEGVTPREAEAFIESHDFNDEIEIEKQRMKWIGIVTLNVPEGKEIEYACYFDSMKDDTIVKYAKPHPIVRTKKFPY